MTKTYERQDGETTKAYTAFTIYRDMGSVRSLDRVEEKIYGTQIGHKRGTNLTSLKRWSREWNWVERCRDYDLDRETEMRQIKSEHEKAAYIRDLENYQLQQKTIGMAALSFTARSLDAIAFILEPIYRSIQESKVLTQDQINILFSSQIASKNLMVAATSGAEMAARGLVIEELMVVVESEIQARSREI
jgi:hypothetical protein